MRGVFWNTGVLCGLTTSLLVNLSCGDKKDSDDDAAGNQLQVVDVCAPGGVLAGECGGDCEGGQDCPTGQFCEGGACTAQCTRESGCVGTCSIDGQCAGQRETVAVVPGQAPSGDFISDPTDTPISDEFAGCATGQAAGQLTAVSLYVMFDNSLSMAEDNKWPQATSAMRAFFEDPETAGLQIALRFFGNNPTPGCDAEACGNDTVGACADPQVALGGPTAESAPADAQEGALVAAVEEAEPDFAGTPMFAALSGSVQWAVQRRAQNPDEAAVVLFLTDGVPQFQDCTEDSAEIAAVAAEGYAQGVRTYAIGLQGSQQAQMDRIAEAGGSGQGIFIGSGDASAQLLTALREIRGQIAACDVQVPAPAAGQTLNPDEVNVTLTLGGDAVPLGQVPDEQQCASNAAWYYDDPAMPSRILLCPATCEAVQNDALSRIDIVLGCETSRTLRPIR